MTDYEIVILLHPDRNEESAALHKYISDVTKKAKGKIHRYEDIGRRSLAYLIQDMPKAIYVLFNIKVPKKTIKSIDRALTLNERVLRYLISKSEPESGDSTLLVQTLKDLERQTNRDNRRHRRDSEDEGKTDTDTELNKLPEEVTEEHTVESPIAEIETATETTSETEGET